MLSRVEREEISRLLAHGDSIRRIAHALGPAPSTIGREVARHGGRVAYRALDADARAWKNARRPKECLLATNAPLRDLVAGKLSQDWSPEQISGWLSSRFGNDPSMQISHETIYRSLFIQARGVLRRDLVTHLRRVRTMRRSINATRAGQVRGQITGAISIRERPAGATDRTVPGHWEGDLI